MKLIVPLAVAASVAGLASGNVAVTHQPDAPLRVLIVGGGPDKKNNQVAIESNVRYVHKVLPAGTTDRVLFADGDPNSRDVLCEDENSRPYYRAPNLPRLDGPSAIDNVQSEVSGLAQRRQDGQLLLYFTGHGSPDDYGNYDNNFFDLWSERRGYRMSSPQELSVRELSRIIQHVPSTTPVTLVMVECYSGAFGNEIFEGGDPGNGLSRRPICGFFASVAQRMAAGCTPEIDEADYKDFTSYFFAALAGVDRMGRRISGADYRHDGRIGMDEAYAYALIHDDSIDTPVCTSDVFLRHFVTVPDREVFSTPYSRVRDWASAPQRAALDALAGDLNIAGESAMHSAYNRFLRISMDTDDIDDVRLVRFVRLAKSVVLGHQVAAGGAPDVKKRYEKLIALEAANPLRG